MSRAIEVAIDSAAYALEDYCLEGEDDALEAAEEFLRHASDLILSEMGVA